MALPILGNHGDIAVEVEWDPVGAAGVYTTWCGASSSEFTVNNEIIATKVADCSDLTKAIQTLKKYGAQDVTISIDANWTKATHQKTFIWATEQKSLQVRLRYPNAAIGEIEAVEGLGLLEGLTLGGIISTEGQPQTEQVNLQISGGITTTFRTV